MVEAKWVQIFFVVFISLEVLVWCVVGEEEKTYKPITDVLEKDDGGKWSWGTGIGNRAWGGFPGYGGDPGGAGPAHCGLDSGCGNGGGGGYVFENGGGNCESNGNIGGAGGGGGGGYGVGVGGGGGGGGGGYGIGVGIGVGGGGGYSGGIGVGGGGYGVGVGGGRVVGNGGGGGRGGVGGGVGVGGSGGGGGLGVGGGDGRGGGGGGFVIPGVSGQPFFCSPLSCITGPCNRLALYLGIEPVYQNVPDTSTHTNNGHDSSYQNVAPGPASEVDGRSSIDQNLEGPTRGINGKDAEHDAPHHEQIPGAVSPASG